MNDRVYLGWLLQYYRPVLSEKQEKAMRLTLEEDLSLAEAAEEMGIARQAVHEACRRAEATLIELENNMHLLQRETEVRKSLEAIRELAAKDSPDLAELRDKISEALSLWEEGDTDGI